MRFATTALIAASAAAAPELIFRDPSSSSDVKLEYADGVLTIPQHCRLQQCTSISASLDHLRVDVDTLSHRVDAQAATQATIVSALAAQQTENAALRSLVASLSAKLDAHGEEQSAAMKTLEAADVTLAAAVEELQAKPAGPTWIKLGNNLAADARSGSSTFSFGKSITFTEIKFEWRSGSVSCNAASAGGTRFSHWGCDPGGEYLGVMLKDSHGSHIAPTDSMNGVTWESSKEWFQFAGQNTMTNPLLFQYPSVRHYAAGTPLVIKYGEADGASMHDNGGVTYLDVWAFGTEA